MGEQNKQAASWLLAELTLLPEDGGSTFIQTAHKRIPDYTAPHLHNQRRENLNLT
jgi:hypothetical protein